MDYTALKPYLTDPGWIAIWIGLVTLIAGVSVPLWIWWRQTELRQLAFGLAASTRLVDVDKTLSGRVTVQLDGRTVENVHSLIFVLRNSGNRPVSANNVHRPLAVTFDSGEVLSCEVSFTQPEQVSASVASCDRTVTLAPCLLNPSDQIAFHVLFSGTDVSFSTNYRIEGVTEMVELDFSRPLPPFWQSGVPSLLFVGPLMFLLAYFWDGAKDPRQLLGAVLSVVFVIAVSAVNRLWHARSANRRIVTLSEVRPRRRSAAR